MAETKKKKGGKYSGIKGAGRFSKEKLDKVYKRGLGAYYSSGSRPKLKHCSPFRQRPRISLETTKSSVKNRKRNLNGSESNAHPLLRTRQARLERTGGNKSRPTALKTSRDTTSDSSPSSVQTKSPSVQTQPTSSIKAQGYHAHLGLFN